MDNLIFKISAHYASAIVNGDYTGLEDHEEKELTEFLEYLVKEYGNCDLSIKDFASETDFQKCEISGYMSDCIEFNLKGI